MATPYESEITRFLKEMLDKNPRLREEQKKARAMWWERHIDPEEQKRYQESREPVRGYYYYPLPRAEQDKKAD